MLPSNASPPPKQGKQAVYQELMTHLGQFFSEETLVSQLNIEQMFILVDGVLPIEACLYYQVLPLFLDGSRLHLGMVNPSDHTASDYVRRIVSYLHYTLVTRPISSQALQAALSAYLKYADSQSAHPAEPEPHTQSGTTERTTDLHSTYPQSIVHNINTDNQETFVLDATSREEIDLDDFTDLGGDRQQNIPPSFPADELTSIDPHDTEIIGLDDTSIHIHSQDQDDDLLLAAAYPDSTVQPAPPSLDDLSDPSTDLGQPSSKDEPSSPDFTSTSSHTLPLLIEESIDAQASGDTPASATMADPLSVEVPTHHLDTDIDRLKILPPRELLRELLARAMGGGIGRLYFERKQNHGRILWSQSGVLQSIVDDIPSVMFQSLINEFKRLTRLPLMPLQKTKQVELERFYRQNRVLMRFRFIPGKHGEQATLQVLRGQALQFYQQQQVRRIGQDAVSIAKQLQAKIEELRSRIKAYPALPDLGQTSLAELKHMLADLEQQVDRLQSDTETVSSTVPPDDDQDNHQE